MLTSALIMTVLTHPGIYSLIDGDKPVYSNSLESHRAYARFWLELITPRASAYPSPVPRIARNTHAEPHNTKSQRALTLLPKTLKEFEGILRRMSYP